MQRRSFNARSRRRGRVAEPGPSTAAQEAEEVQPVAQDEYPTEVFGTVRHATAGGTGAAGPDRGTDVVDEWEQALRGSGPAEPETATSGPADEHGGHGDAEGSDAGADAEQGYPGQGHEVTGHEVTGHEVAAPEHDEAAPATSAGHADSDGAGDGPDDVPARLFGTYPGTDDRVDTAVIPRITDQDGPPSEGEDEYRDDEYRDDEYQDDEDRHDEDRDDAYGWPEDDHPVAEHHDGGYLDDGHDDDGHDDDGHEADSHDGAGYDDAGRGERDDAVSGDDAHPVLGQHDNEQPGESTEMIPAYRDEEQASEQPTPEPEAAPAPRTVPSYLDPLRSGPAKWERKRQQATGNRPEPTPEGSAEPDEEDPGERTELIEAYRDEDHQPAAAEEHEPDQHEPDQHEPDHHEPEDAGTARTDRGPSGPGGSMPEGVGLAAGIAAGAAGAGLVAAGNRRGDRAEAPDRGTDGAQGADTRTDTRTDTARDARGEVDRDGRVVVDGGPPDPRAEGRTVVERQEARPDRPGRRRDRSGPDGAGPDTGTGRGRPGAPAGDTEATEVMPVHRDGPGGRVGAGPDAHTSPGTRAAHPADPGPRPGKGGNKDRNRGGEVAAGRKPVALVAVLLVVAVLGGVAAYFFSGRAAEASLAFPTNNTALIDQAATEQVTTDVTKAVEAAYSYDSTQLDASENRALTMLTGSYVDQFKQNFNQVRQLGPKANLSLQSKVAAIGVETLSDDNATLLVMLNQVGHRGDSPQPLTANIRLSVTAEKVGGQWKVSEVDTK